MTLKKMLFGVFGICTGMTLFGGPLTGLIDLAGVDRTETNGLSGDAVITNASATAATLTIALENGVTNFAGRIAGAVNVVKTGAGTQALAPGNTFSGTVRVNDGFLSFSDETAFGTDDNKAVFLAGGGVLYTGPERTGYRPYTVDGTGTFSVAAGGKFTLVPSRIVQNNFGQTVIKDGEGTLVISDKIGVVNKPTRFIVRRGALMQGGSDLFGQHSSTTTNFVLDVREGAVYKMMGNTHSPVGPVILTGGTFDCLNAASGSKWGNTAFRGGVTAHAAAAPSFIRLGVWAHLNHVYENVSFCVDAGATLVVDGVLTNGFNAGATDVVKNRLLKTGDGDLVLTRDSAFTGGFDLGGGTLSLYNDLSFGTGPVAVSADTKLLVAEGVSVTAPVLSGPARLTKTGLGELLFTTVPETLPPLTVKNGICAFPSLAGIPDSVVFEDASVLGLGDFAASWAAARTRWPGLAGVVNAGAPVSLETISPDPAVGTWTIGAVAGTSLTVGSVTGVDALVIAGEGTTTCGALAGTIPVTVRRGAVAYLPADVHLVAGSEGLVYPGSTTEGVIDTLTLEADQTINVPEGETVTINRVAAGTSVVARLPNLVKTGAGTLVFPKDTDLSSLYNNLTVREGFVRVASEASFGAGSVTLAGGGLELTTSYSQKRVPIILSGTGTVYTPEETTFTITSNLFTSANATFIKTGPGSLRLGTRFMFAVKNSRWVIDGGDLSLTDGDVFGGHTYDITHTLEFHEGTSFKTWGHLPLGNVILRGAEMYSRVYQTSGEGTWGKSVALEDFCDWKAYGLNKTVTVEPASNGAPSVIRAVSSHLGHGSATTVFDVKEGAELRVECPLYPGQKATGGVRTDAGSGFIKRGKGTLTLLKPCSAAGTLTMEDGVLVLTKESSLNPDMKIVSSGNGTIRLEDGAILSNTSEVPHQLLSTAGVWMDASRLTAADGAQISSVPNNGTAGGSFGRFTTGIAPDAPTLMKNAINGLPALNFDGTQALVLKSYTNTTDNFTLFLVAEWNTWEDVSGKGKWSGPCSFCSDHATNSDHLVSGSFHYEYGSGVTTATANYGLQGNFWFETEADNGTPYLSLVTRTYTRGEMLNYIGDRTAPKTGALNFTENRRAPMDVNLVALGGRIGFNGVAQYYGADNTANRMMVGHIGEMIAFSRTLTSNETAVILSYLQRKWFGSTVPPVRDPDLTGLPLTVEVPADANAAVTGSLVLDSAADDATSVAALTKTGTGSLRLGALGTAPTTIRVNDGTLALSPETWQSHAEIWMDAADSSSLTIEDGLVTSAANKGRTGGAFVRNLRNGRNTPCPPYAATGLNGHPSLSFNGNAALALGTYTNKCERRDLHIYAAMNLTSYSELNNAGGYGKWSGPFSFSRTTATANDEGVVRSFHLEKGSLTGMSFDFGTNGVYPSDRTQLGEPYLLVCHQNETGYLIAMETAADPGKVPVCSSSQYTIEGLDVDVVQLGGRLGPGAGSQWFGQNNSANRMWFGNIGEFIVFNKPLNKTEETALLAYLRKKWLSKGNGSEEAPVCLTGERIAPMTTDGTWLVLEDGTELLHGAATQPLAGLEVNGNVLWTRAGVRTPSAFTLFDVAGDIALNGLQTLSLASAPTAGTAVLRCDGTLTADEPAWLVTGEKASTTSVKAVPTRRAVLLSRDTAGVIFLR